MSKVRDDVKKQIWQTEKSAGLKNIVLRTGQRAFYFMYEYRMYCADPEVNLVQPISVKESISFA